MKVLQILPELNAGGVERTTLEIAEALISHGHEAHICSNGGRLLGKLEAMGAIHHNLKIGSKNPLKLRGHTKALIDIIKSENIDIVHARSRAPAWPAHGAAKATNRPFVTTYHGIYNAKSRAKRRYNAIMAKGNAIIANSEYTKRHIIKEHGTSSDSITVIPRGVDMSLFDPENITIEMIESIRQSWHSENNDKIVLLPGRLTQWKGQKLAIQALGKCPENVKLVMMGDPQGRSKYVAELIQLASSLGLSDRIRLPGHFENVPAALMAADLVIAPSIEPEAFGRVVAEAQAMGRFVIASNHGGPVETIIPDKTGFLFEAGDAEKLTEAILTGLNLVDYDPVYARKHVSHNFSKAQLQSRTLEVYRQMMM